MKRNKKAIVITAIVMFIGVLLVLLGFFGNWFFGLFKKGFDYKNIKSEDLGKTIETDLYVYYESIDLVDKRTQFVGNPNVEGAFILVDLTSLSEPDKNYYYSSFGKHVTVTGTLKALDETEFQEMKDSIFRFYDPYYEETKDRSGITLEEFHDMLLEMYMPYCIEIKTIGAFNWMTFIPAGIIFFVIALIGLCFEVKHHKLSFDLIVVKRNQKVTLFDTVALFDEHGPDLSVYVTVIGFHLI